LPSFLLKALAVLLFLGGSIFLIDYLWEISWVEPLVYVMVLNLLPVLRMLNDVYFTSGGPSLFFTSILWVFPSSLRPTAPCPCSCWNWPSPCWLTGALPRNLNPLDSTLHMEAANLKCEY
jgi:hypothetical protein